MGHLDTAAQIVAGLDDNALLLDARLKHVAHNPAFGLLLGVRPRILQRFLSQDNPFNEFGNAGAHSMAERCLREQEVIRLHEVDFKLPSGASVKAIVTFLPVIIPSTKQCIGVMYIVRDVSAESRMQQRFKELLAKEQARADDLEQRVGERTRELRAALQEVTRLARTDPLTGALNRRALSEYAEQSLRLAERYERSIGFLMCDLDFFKKVNDNYGHQAGDAVLVEAVKALSGVVRGTDKIGRFGGEEFVVLLSETAKDTICEIGSRCNEVIRAMPFKELVGAKQGRQTVSIGCAFYPDHGSTLDQLLLAADCALIYAKENGRDRVVVYSPDLETKASVSAKGR